MKSFGVPSADTLFENNGRGNNWGPLVDGVIVKQSPSQTGVKVPSIFGSNTQDGALFVLSQYQNPKVNQSEWNSFLTKNFGPYAAVVNQSVPASAFDSTPYPTFYRMAYVITQVGYRCTGYRGAITAAQNHVPVWVYSFNHTPSCNYLTSLPNVAPILKLLGPTHTAELPFVWGLTSNLPAGVGNCTLTSSEQALSLWMREAWTNMAENGNPGERWPAFNASYSQGINFNDVADAGIVDFSVCAALFDSLNANISALATTAASNTTNSTSSGTTIASASGSTTTNITSASMFLTFAIAVVAALTMLL
jgi:carboxylesterase type B